MFLRQRLDLIEIDEMVVGAHAILHGIIPFARHGGRRAVRSEEHTSELQSLMRTSSAVFCFNKQNRNTLCRGSTTFSTDLNAPITDYSITRNMLYRIPHHYERAR